MAIQGKQLADNTVERVKLNLPAIPTTDDDIVLKGYLDNVITGLSPKDSVRSTTNTAIPSSVYDNGNNGQGATLTGAVNGAITIDGVSVAVNDRILLKNQLNAVENGVYVVTTVGDGSNPFVLTRSTDFDGNPINIGEIQRGDYVFTVEGTVNGGYGFVVISTGTGTDQEHVVGTGDINWSQVSQSQTYTAGDGLQLTGSEFSIVYGSAAGQLNAATVPLNTGGSYGGNANNVQDALEELETNLTLNFTNGLTKTGSDISLGGTLTEASTLVNGGQNNIAFVNNGDFTARANNAGATIISQLLLNPTGGIDLAFINVTSSIQASLDLATTGQVQLYGSSTGGQAELRLNNGGTGGHIFSDGSISPEGLKYGADYGATLVARSLIDKGNVEELLKDRGFGFQTGNSSSAITTNNADTGITCSLTDARNTALVMVNNIPYIVNNSITSVFYFSSDGGTSATTTFTGANLFFNALIAEFNLSTTDSIVIIGMVSQ